MSKKKQRLYAITLLHYDYETKVKKLKSELAKEIRDKTSKEEDILGFWDNLDIQFELGNITAKQVKLIKKGLKGLNKQASKFK